MASKPANFSSAGKNPPASEEPTPPVSGELATALGARCPEIGAPVSPDTARVSVFSGPYGSAPAGVWRSR